MDVIEKYPTQDLETCVPGNVIKYNGEHCIILEVGEGLVRIFSSESRKEMALSSDKRLPVSMDVSIVAIFRRNF